MLTEQQVAHWGPLSVNERRKNLIDHFGYGLLAQAWDELEYKRSKAPKDINLSALPRTDLIESDQTLPAQDVLAPDVQPEEDDEDESATLPPEPKKKGKKGK